MKLWMLMPAISFLTIIYLTEEVLKKDLDL